ncbi:MAG: type II secretion system protein GspD [Putridiphycobacter sp.]
MKKLLFIVFIICGFYLNAQQDINAIKSKFEELSKTQVGLNEKVEVNISGIPLSSFITTIASEHNLNVSVDDNLNHVIVSNFYDAQVKDVFVFLVKKYNLTVEFTGSIIAFKATPEEIQKPPVYKPKTIDVKYRPDNTFLSLDLKNDSLYRVAEAITKKSGNNVILSPTVKEKVVSVYIENRPFENALELMAKSNGLEVIKNGNGVYYIEKSESAQQTTNNSNNRNNNNYRNNSGTNKGGGLKINLNGNDKLDVEATNVQINDIINQASDLTGDHFFMYDVPDGSTSLFIENISYEELLINILKGTDYTYKKTDDYYVIGNRNTEGLRTFELIQLENRSIETVNDLIPKDLLNGIELKEYLELNGFMASGSYVQIQELKTFLKAVDIVVPMVQIDVIIVLSGKSTTLSTGIKAGISDAPVTTNGDIFPGLDVTAGAQTINGLINAFNGFGVLNLGMVTPNFYLSLKALETNSIIDMTSTPKISTLNGHQASLIIGETDYYEQVQTTFTNTVSGGNVGSSKVYVPTEANLSITVKPFVSADEYVTLEIKVEQSDFKSRTSPDAPPGKTTQTFESLIRVKNGEMIMMGGLEKKKKNDTGSGTPFLSRVPVLKWFFSSREKEKDKSKLHIFIKPTVTY